MQNPLDVQSPNTSRHAPLDLIAFPVTQQRRAEREIARFLATRGPLTDEVEREIMRRLSGSRPH